MYDGRGERGSTTMSSVAFILRVAATAVALRAVQEHAAAPLAGPPAATRPAAQAESQQFFEEGSRALDQRHPQRAVELLSEAVIRRPDAAAYVLKLAQAYDAAKRGDAAVALLENYVRSFPDATDARIALAALHTRAGRSPRAEALLAPHEPDLPAAGALALADARRADPVLCDETLRRALERFPNDASLWLARVALAASESRWAGALALLRDAKERCGETPELCFQAARAHFELGQLLGATVTRDVPDGQPGRFHGDLLLIERTREPCTYLCAPRASALYQVRRALDAGRDTPDTHLLHARIWRRIGRPQVAYELLKAREAELTDAPFATPEALEVFAGTALDAGRPAESLRFAQRWAALEPARRDQILRDAYLRQAEAANQRGEEAVYLDFLARAARVAPADAELLLRLADANWSAARGAAARDAYEALLRLAPHHPRRATILERLAQLEASRPDRQ